MRSLALPVLLCLGVGLWCAEAHGQPSPRTDGPRSDVALDKGHEGLALFSDGRFEEALSAFTSAEAIAHSPVFVLYQARATKELGRLFESRQHYRQASEEVLSSDAPDAWIRARADARRELRELDLLVPRLSLTFSGGVVFPVSISCGARASTASEPSFEIESDPGLYTVAFEDASGTKLTRVWAARVGERSETIEIAFPQILRVDPPAPPAPSPSAEPRKSMSSLTAGALAAFSAGGVGFVGAAVFGGLAYDRASSIRDNCIENSCLVSDIPRLDEARRFANLATAGLVVSVVGSATGVGLLLLDSRDEDGMRVSVGWGRLEFERRF